MKTKTTNPNYTVDYFIEKFTVIPDNKWIIGSFNFKNKHCALGHCFRNNSDTDESIALRNLFRNNGLSIVAINDASSRFMEDTPKARVLAALNYIKEKQK